MPTYQYRCTDCGQDLEAVQKFSDAALTECPNCGGSLRKLFNAVGVVFKGSGFYRTDSRTTKGDGDGGSTDKGERKDSGAKEKKDAKEPAAATAAAAATKATNGSGSGSGSAKQPATSGSSSTGGSSST
jgi:putative FmdB family regulatory protein